MNYLEQIENAYSNGREQHSRLSPMDWNLAAKWEDSGVPLHIVLSAMTEIFKKYKEKNPHGKKINSLSYFKQEVESKFAEWSSRMVGKSIETENQNAGMFFADEIYTTLWQIKEQLQLSLHGTKLPFSLHEIVAETESAIGKLLETYDDEKELEDNLSKIALKLNYEVLKSLSDCESKKFSEAIKKDFKDFDCLSNDRQESLFLKYIFKEYHLPIISLYEL